MAALKLLLSRLPKASTRNNYCSFLGEYSTLVSKPGVALMPNKRTRCISGILAIITTRNIAELTTTKMGLYSAAWHDTHTLHIRIIPEQHTQHINLQKSWNQHQKLFCVRPWRACVNLFVYCHAVVLSLGAFIRTSLNPMKEEKCSLQIYINIID